MRFRVVSPSSASVCRIVLFLLIAGFAAASSAHAHGLGVLGSGKSDRVLEELDAIFGLDASFSANAKLIEKDKAAKVPRTSELEYQYRKGDVRLVQDAATRSYLSAQNIEDLKRMRTDILISIVRPHQRTRYLIYPGLESYTVVEEPAESSGEDGDAKRPKPKKVEIGKETVEGHACIKYRITYPDDEEGTEITTWQAEDLDNFPVQVQVVHGNQSVTLQFRDIESSSLDPASFKAPAGYKRYDSPSALFAAINPPAPG
jgi:hypothetical protein